MCMQHVRTSHSTGPLLVLVHQHLLEITPGAVWLLQQHRHRGQLGRPVDDGNEGRTVGDVTMGTQKDGL